MCIFAIQFYFRVQLCIQFMFRTCNRTDHISDYINKITLVPYYENSVFMNIGNGIVSFSHDEVHSNENIEDAVKRCTFIKWRKRECDMRELISWINETFKDITKSVKVTMSEFNNSNPDEPIKTLIMFYNIANNTDQFRRYSNNSMIPLSIDDLIDIEHPDNNLVVNDRMMYTIDPTQLKMSKIIRETLVSMNESS